MNIKRATVGFLLSFVFLFVFVYLISGAQSFFTIPLPEIQDIGKYPADILQSVVNINLESNAAISLETDLGNNSKIIFEKNGLKKMPIASLTKLVTAIIVLDNYKLSDVVAVDELAYAQAPMKQDVKLGDVFSVESFLELMLVESSNKSAYALAEKMGEQKFVNLMNQKVKEIGLKNTFFVDPTGLSFENVSTAEDLAKLAEYILKNYPKIADISQQKELEVPGFGVVTNSDQLLGEVPGIVFSKTGFTTEAKGCLLLVTNNVKNNDYIINVVLGADDRFAEMKKLIANCK